MKSVAAAVSSLVVVVAIVCCGKMQATIPQDVAFAVCVLSNVAADEQAGLSGGAIASDLAARCGGDLASVIAVLDARHVSIVQEGGAVAPFATQVGR